jgi:hypothetical protein
MASEGDFDVKPSLKHWRSCVISGQVDICHLISVSLFVADGQVKHNRVYRGFHVLVHF